MFEQRSQQLELLDAPDIPRDLLFQNLREIETINKLLGGIGISLAGLRRTWKPGEELVLADIGCGGGDALRAFAGTARKAGVPARFIGIDLKQDCIDFARDACREYPEISFACMDYREAIQSIPEVTHVHAALFCHHLDNTQLVELLQFCQKHQKKLIVNDLQRHPFAYYSIQFLTWLLRGSKLVRNDAPLSVLRGFQRQEWEKLMHQAGIASFRIQWRWAFRHLITLNPNGH